MAKRFFFIRAYIIAAVVIPFVVMGAYGLMHATTSPLHVEYLNEFASLEAAYIEKKFRDIPQPEWQKWIDEHESPMSLDVELYEVGSVPVSAVVPVTDAPGVRHSGGIHPKWWLDYPLPNSNMRLLFTDLEAGFIPVDAFQWTHFILQILVAYLAVIICVISLAYFVSRPILGFSEAVNRFGSGDMETRVAQDMPKPLDKLARNFNRMADRIQQLVTEQRVMIGAVPHELRTPLARLRMALDTTRKAETVEQFREKVEQIDQYLDDLEEVTEDSLLLASLQQKTQIPRSQQFSLKSALRDIASRRQRKTIQLDCTCDIEQPVYGDQSLMQHAINNLLDNALRHARSRVVVTARHAGDKVSLRVDDDGPGIPEGQRNDVLIPFFRLDRSRVRQFGGSGLGLALVNIIIERHAGEIRVSDSDLGGARFELIW